LAVWRSRKSARIAVYASSSSTLPSAWQTWTKMAQCLSYAIFPSLAHTSEAFQCLSTIQEGVGKCSFLHQNFYQQEHVPKNLPRGRVVVGHSCNLFTEKISCFTPFSLFAIGV
jgi:hypothetical protein